MTKKLLVISGPTASGKTALSLQLSQQMPLCLLNADSMQVYQDLDIGTAKPSVSERQHFGLLDLVKPGQDFSAGDFQRAALPLIEAAWQASQIPCLVGGSGFYLRAVCDGLAQVPPIPLQTRHLLQKRLETQGLASLARELEAKDPQTASHTALENPRRVLRALEVLEATGQGLAHWQSLGLAGAAPYDSLLFLYLDPGPETLEKNIHARAKTSLSAGWLEETRSAVAKYGREALLSVGVIGYAELLRHSDGEISLADAEKAIILRTRQYARRQRTWFRKENRKIEIQSPIDLYESETFKEWIHAP